MARTLQEVKAFSDSLDRFRNESGKRVNKNWENCQNFQHSLNQSFDRQQLRLEQFQRENTKMTKEIETTLHRVTKTETIAKNNKIMVEKFDTLKIAVPDFNEYKKAMEERTGQLDRRIGDTFNRMVTTDIYLDKYLPYNTFVMFCEVLHVALDKKALLKLEDYENAKLQNFLAEILLNMGRKPDEFDKDRVNMPSTHHVNKPYDCDCNLSHFKNILHK